MSAKLPIVIGLSMGLAGAGCSLFGGKKLPLAECQEAVKTSSVRFQSEIRDIVVSGRNCLPGGSDPGRCSRLTQETQEGIRALHEQFIASAFVRQCSSELSVKGEFMPVLDAVLVIARENPDTLEEQARLQEQLRRLEDLDENLSVQSIVESCCQR